MKNIFTQIKNFFLKDDGDSHYKVGMSIILNPEKLLDQSQVDCAVNEMKIAAKLGHLDAQYQLARLYSKYTRPVNFSEAFKWFKLSAKRGHVASQSQLGTIYYFGERGAKVNFKKAENGFSKQLIKNLRLPIYVLRGFTKTLGY